MAGPSTDLQDRIAREIMSAARRSGWSAGHHVTELELQTLLGTSRTPIRAAMAQLERRGLFEKRPNRGYFLKHVPAADQDTPAAGDDQDDERVYLAIAMDRLKRVLPDRVSESDLIRRYGITRARLRLVLTRIAAEGWIERTPGRGWVFQSLIDAIEAYRETYAFRRMIEPEALRLPSFKVDREVLARLEAQQVFVRERGFETLSQIDLYQINAGFHEGLASLSGNRFVVQTLTRLNQLRRLVEYGRPVDRERVRRVCSEHLDIVAALGRGDVDTAAKGLDAHLRDASREKAGD